MHVEGGGPDQKIAQIASGQRGLVTRNQLLAVGLGRGALAHRISARRLHRVHRGVYLVGHTVLPPLAREMAAVLALGGGAVLSHRSAARCWLLTPGSEGDIDVTVAGRIVANRRGVRVHCVSTLDSRDTTRRHDLPITTPARTLLDLADVADERELERAVDEAFVRRLVDRRRLVAVLARAPGRHGAAPLKALIRREGGPTLTRSEAEERVLSLVRAARLPAPEVNVRIEGHVVDLYWRQERLVVEIDGWKYHSTRAAFERDRRRDADLDAAGLRVIRVTWRQIVDEREALVARLVRALMVRSASG